MKWEICSNSESYEMLSRDEIGKMIAHIFIDDGEGITTFAKKDGTTHIEDFPPKTNLMDVQNHIKEILDYED